MSRTGKSGLWQRYLESLKHGADVSAVPFRKRDSRRHHRRAMQRRPEILEQRTLLSAAAGMLDVSELDGSDDLADQDRLETVGDHGPNELSATRGPEVGDLVYGLGGDDTLISDGGPDQLFGGDGDDRLVIGSWPVEQIDGGPGVDVLQIGAPLLRSLIGAPLLGFQLRTRFWGSLGGADFDRIRIVEIIEIRDDIVFDDGDPDRFDGIRTLEISPADVRRLKPPEGGTTNEIS